MKLKIHLFFLLLFQYGFTQQNYFDEWYSSDSDHLPQNSVKSIAPDKYGFIWMTTENGLVRFDGKDFKVFNDKNINIKSNRFLYLKGSIEKDSLITYSEFYNDVVFINKRNATKSKSKFQLTDSEKYEKTRFYFNSNTKQNKNFLNCIINDNKRNYYKIEKERIVLFSKSNKEIKSIRNSYNSKKDYFLLNDELVILDEDGTYVFFNNSIKNNIVLPKNAKFIYNYLTQQYFICTDTEIFQLQKNKNNLTISLIHKLNSKRNYIISCLYYDSTNKKIFIGTQNVGLHILTISDFTVLVNPNTIENFYYATFPFSENEFITANGELYNTNNLIKELNLNQHNEQRAIAIDKNKNIWIKRNNELIRFNYNTNYKTSDKIYLKNFIATIYCDSKNTIWIGYRKIHNTEQFTVTTIDANQSKITPKDIKTINEPIQFFAEYKNKQMLMVGENVLLNYNQNSKSLHKYYYKDNDIRSIFICQKNEIWVCTYNNGFSLFQNGVFHKMPTDNSLFLNSTHCISEDKNGHFWISTNKGLIEVEAKSLLNYVKFKTPIYYHHYDKKNGFLMSEFNGGCQPCNTELENGYFIFPSLNGLVSFLPDNVTKITPSNDFFVNEVIADNKTILFNNSITLDRDFNRFKFKIDFPYFGNKNNINFEYKLEINGREKWISIGQDRNIVLTNIPPGTYKLYIRKLNGFDSKYQTKVVLINIPYLFYEKLWFKILLFALLFGIVIMIILFRSYYLKKKNIELEQIILNKTIDLQKTVENLKITQENLSNKIIQQKKLIGTISHDIKSPLKFLSITAKYLFKNSIENNNEGLQNNAKIINDSANELYRFVENLVDYSKIYLDQNNIEKLIAEDISIVINDKINLFKNLALANETKIEYQNHIKQNILINKKALAIIIHNLLDNSTKHTFKGTITLETKILKNKFYFTIEDTGIGFSEPLKKYYLALHENYNTEKLIIQKNGLGLYMVLELLKLINGDIKINSEENKGTKITIILDVDYE
ncbi:ligand-binding sensor domain-containing protein [Flavobacterium urocaniciphilum]|uniref:histidine kinase n=1 Tax=Flavobacterium urocaniciphilum TaxID=1299341 RepID=A0A1H9DS98_9FLAO|nr:sensor histidine kinase [Flavobacterium urocaniciphilum]SEQ15583.1 Signal transduction histidine kinase [Flavobacterium urocaniciphilum]